MGSHLSKWRQRLSIVETLEKLEKDIDYLKQCRQTNVEQQKRIIACLIFYSAAVYILSITIFYFYCWPTEGLYRIIYTLPLLLFPVTVWMIKRFLHWYFIKRIRQNEQALEELKEKKKTILNDVMERETYKKAKEILEKFSAESKTEKLAIAATPRPNSASISSVHIPPTGPPMVRPVLPRERTIMDRFVEYLLGVGPQNRYALICSQCHSHNGMAIKEEFDYLNFRCCYCYAMNPARRFKPRAPPLDPVACSQPQHMEKTLVESSTGLGEAGPDEGVDDRKKAETMLEECRNLIPAAD